MCNIFVYDLWSDNDTNIFTYAKQSFLRLHFGYIVRKECFAPSKFYTYNIKMFVTPFPKNSGTFYKIECSICQIMVGAQTITLSDYCMCTWHYNPYIGTMQTTIHNDHLSYNSLCRLLYNNEYV